MPPDTDTLEKPTADAAAAVEKVVAPTEGAKEGQADAAAKDAGADKAADAKPVDGDKKPADGVTLDPDGDADPEDKGADLTAKAADDGKAPDADKDKKPETGWTDLRTRAIEREIKRVEGQLSKKLTAAELPKELAKRRSALEKTLARYGSVEDALIAGYNAAEKIRTGAHKQPLPDDATDAEKSEWRKSNNIPDKAEDYEVPKVAGHQWTDADQPALNALKAEAFKNNWPQEVVSGVTSFYANLVEEAKDAAETATVERDRANLEARRDRRRELWGSEAKSVQKVLDKALSDDQYGVIPSQIGQAMGSARLPDGTRLFDVPGFEPFLYDLVLVHKGEGAFVSGEQAAASVSEKNEIEALMASDIDTYQNKPWKSTGMTASQRYYEILKKEESRKGRAG